MWLQTRMFLLVALLFGILYGVITAVGAYTGIGNAYFYLALAFVFLGIQYLIGPAIVSWTMKVKSCRKSHPRISRKSRNISGTARLAPRMSPERWPGK